jgi:hypothetical protein
LLPLLLTGCLASSKVKPVESQPESQGQAMELARSLRQEGQDISTLAARGSVEYTADNSNHFFRFEFLSQKPGSFLFTILDPLGRPAVRVVSDGITFMALEYGPKMATVGEAQSQQALATFLPLGFTSADFIALLTGSLVPEPELASLTPSGEGKEVLRVIPTGRWSGSNWLVSLSTGQHGRMINSFTVGFTDEQPLTATYSQFAAQTIEDTGKAIDFPNRLDLNWGRDKKLLVRYDEVRLGFPAQPGMFSTTVPSGFNKVEL